MQEGFTRQPDRKTAYETVRETVRQVARMNVYKPDVLASARGVTVNLTPYLHWYTTRTKKHTFVNLLLHWHVSFWNGGSKRYTDEIPHPQQGSYIVVFRTLRQPRPLMVRRSMVGLREQLASMRAGQTAVGR